MSDGPAPNDPAEQLGEAVQDTVTTVQDNAAAAIADAEQRAQQAAETVAHMAEAARESAIGQELARHREEQDQWRAGLESRLSETERQVSILPQTLSETIAQHTASLRADLEARLNPTPSTPPPPSTDPQTAADQTAGSGTDGPRASPAAPEPAPRKRRHVL